MAALREEQGLAQEKLAWEANLRSKGYLSRIEAGERLPSLQLLQQLADRLGVEVRDLLIFPERGGVDKAMDELRARSRILSMPGGDVARGRASAAGDDNSCKRATPARRWTQAAAAEAVGI